MKWIKHLLWKYVTQDPQYEETQIPCPEITIEEVAPDLYAKLLSEATAHGAKFEGTNANISDCDFDWSYDEPSQTLHITCLKKPFYISCGLVEEKIRELIKNAKETP